MRLGSWCWTHFLMAKPQSGRQAELAVVVLAAGQGRRMRSKLPKVLHPLAGRPLLEHVLETVGLLRPAGVFVVVGHQAERVRAAIHALSSDERPLRRSRARTAM